MHALLRKALSGRLGQYDANIEEAISSAILDPSGTYRYWLFRSWDKSLPHVCFCMLNPSTADATCDDPTIRRCIGFAKAWGCGSLSVVNLFAYHATSPKELKLVPDPIGLYNYHFIQQTSQHANMTVAAWGIHGNQLSQGQMVLPMLKNPVCLGLTSAGHPKHPLYVVQDTPLMSYTAVACAKQVVGSDAAQQQLCQPTCTADDGSM